MGFIDWVIIGIIFIVGCILLGLIYLGHVFSCKKCAEQPYDNGLDRYNDVKANNITLDQHNERIESEEIRRKNAMHQRCIAFAEICFKRAILQAIRSNLSVLSCVDVAVNRHNVKFLKIACGDGYFLGGTLTIDDYEFDIDESVTSDEILVSIDTSAANLAKLFDEVRTGNIACNNTKYSKYMSNIDIELLGLVRVK